MYMNAAKESGYNLVFVDKYGMERYHRYKIETGKSIFVKNADDFLETQGNNWYFCKCKEGKKQACLGSIFGTLSVAEAVREIVTRLCLALNFFADN